MPGKAPKLVDDLGVAISRIVFGGHKTPLILVLILLLPIALNIFSNQLSTDLQGQTAARWLIYGTCGLLLVAVLWTVGRAAVGMRLTILQDENPPACRALILFLSPPLKDSVNISGWSQDAALRGTIHESATCAKFEGPWRMTFEAIRHHSTRLTEVILLPSSDAREPVPKEDGTWRHVLAFVGLASWLCAKPSLRIHALTELTKNKHWEQGVDFEDAQDLVDAITEVYSSLQKEGIEDYDIMIDVTGGQKPPAVAGAAVALDRGGRRCQYVSTRNYRIKAFDITYRSSE